MKVLAFLTFILMGIGAGQRTFAAEPATPATAATCTLQFSLEGAIGPATLDFIERVLQRAEKRKCSSVLTLINTPGGNLQTTRLIVEKILNSPVPFLCLISPSGAHAGSAGAIIMQACHVNGGVTATNIGAATPVSGGGQELTEDLRNKLINDTRSWTEGLARLRGRNEGFARDIVELAKAVSIDEAKKLKAVDWTGSTKQGFLDFAEGRKAKMAEDVVADVHVGTLVDAPLDLRYKVMSTLTDPQIAYMMFMGSLGLLYFELTHPGMIAPGVIGVLGLLLSFLSFHMLDVAVTGVLLIFLGVGLMIAEAFVASFGVLGLGGVVAFFLGSLFLFDPETSGVALPLSTIFPTTLLLGILMMGIAYLAFSSRRARRNSTFDAVIGRVGRVSEISADGPRAGMVDVAGEIWKFEADEDLSLKDEVTVVAHKGLTLKVKRK